MGIGNLLLLAALICLLVSLVAVRWLPREIGLAFGMHMATNGAWLMILGNGANPE